MKYALVELERRWLLAERPDDVLDAVRIVDHYVPGTNFRLRSVDGVFKLAHKVRPRPDDPSEVLITNMYVTKAEHDLLVASLPTHRLVKTRHHVAYGQRRLSVDVFEEHLAGLVLLEADFPSREAMHAFVPPSYAGREVTADDRFSGGSLSRARP